MPVGQSGRTPSGNARASTRSPLNVEISAKIPLRDFLVSANIPTGLDCAGLCWTGPLALMGIMCSGLRVEATPLTVPTRLHSLPPRGTATHAGVVLMMETKGHARGARRVEGTGITDLRPLVDSLDTYARQIHSIAEIIRSIEEESAKQSTEAKAAENTAPCSPHDGQQHLTSTLPAVGWRPLPVISDTLDRTPVIQAHAAPVVDTISPEAICQRALGARKAAEARAKEWVPDRLCAMEQNSVRASDGKLLLALKVIAAVIGIIGIALLAFPDPMRKLVDSFGRIKPLGSAAHLAIENQKGLTIELLPLGISVADGSGGETVTVAGLAGDTDLSFGTALGAGNWLVTVADLDKTFVGVPMGFVGVMTAKVTLNSATGKRLDTRNIRYEWSKPESYSAPPAE